MGLGATLKSLDRQLNSLSGEDLEDYRSRALTTLLNLAADQTAEKAEEQAQERELLEAGKQRPAQTRGMGRARRGRPSGGAPARRGRGRPRGSKNKPKRGVGRGVRRGRVPKRGVKRSRKSTVSRRARSKWT